jgi:hypothetical protein
MTNCVGEDTLQKQNYALVFCTIGRNPCSKLGHPDLACALTCIGKAAMTNCVGEDTLQKQNYALVF